MPSARPTLPLPSPAAVFADDRPGWRLRLCGQARVESAQGGCIDLERRDAAMLALLAIDGPIARRRMLELLWPDEDVEQVRGRLRQRIHALKRKLGTEAIAGGATLALAPGLAWPGFAHEAADRPLLGDDDHADLHGFAEWLAASRAHLHERRRDGIAAQASALEQQGRLAEALAAGERLCAMEPLQEHAHRRLMRLHYLRGDRAAAVAAFERCERLLKDELGLRPSTETLALLDQIESARLLPTVAPPLPPTVQRPPRLVGREAEWAALTAAWREAVPAALVGEAGLGKTRLLGDLVSAHGDARIVQAHARPGDGAVPCGLLGRLLRALLPLAGPLEPGVRRELARLLPELGDAPAEASAARFHAAVELTLQSAAARGLQAVVLDDLHFADAASLETVHRLAGAGSGSGVRWLFAMRESEAGPEARAVVAEIGRSGRGRCLRLAPLAEAAVAELVDSLGIADLDGARLAPLLVRRTGGNPMFVLECLKQGIDPRDTQAVPLQLTTLMTRRIEQLSRDAVRIARCAAIAGQDFSPALAAAVLDVNPLDLADAWAELEQAQVLRGEAFAHDLIADAARASVPAPIARELHRRIATLLQAGQAPAARLAAHWLGAGDEARAAPCLASAARGALRALRLHEALECFDQARQMHARLGEVEPQLQLIGEFAEAAKVAGRSAELQRLAEQALAEAGGERHRAMACAVLSNLVGGRADYVVAAAWAERAIAHARAARDRPTEFEARCQLARVQGPLGRGDRAVALLAPIEPWVLAQGSADVRLAFHDTHAAAMSAAGRLHDAIREWQAAAAVAREVGNALVLPELTMQIATAQFFLGRAEAGRLVAEGIVKDHADLPVDSVFRRQTLRALLAMDRDLARYTAALATAEGILQDPSASGHELDNARLYSAAICIELGQPARARRLLAQSEAEGAIAINDVFWSPLRVELAQGCPEEARVRAEAVRAAHAAGEGRSGRTLYPIRRLLARFADDPAVAIEAAQAALDTASRSDAQGQVLVFKALLAHRLAAGGDARNATRLAREAWATPAEVAPASIYRGQVWLWLHGVLAAHDEALAQQIARHAGDWVLRTAVEQVPAAFRESFLRRQPVNVALMRLAGGQRARAVRHP